MFAVFWETQFASGLIAKVMPPTVAVLVSRVDLLYIIKDVLLYAHDISKVLKYPALIQSVVTKE